MSKLTVKQRKFISRYLDNNGNGTQAVLSVYDVSNKNSAAAISCKLLRKANIQEAIVRNLEAEGSVLSRTVQLLDDVSNNGTPHDQLKACQVVLKLYGLL